MQFKADSDPRKVRLTADRIRRFICPKNKQQVFLTDTESQGLKVRCTVQSKPFVFETKLNRRTMRFTVRDVRT